MNKHPYRESESFADSPEPWGMWLRRRLAPKWGKPRRVQMLFVIGGVLGFVMAKLHESGFVDGGTCGIIGLVAFACGVTRFVAIVEDVEG